MIAMSMISTYDEYRRSRSASAPVYPVPAHPLRRAMMRALSMLGRSVGGVAAVNDGGTSGSAE
jgi:hypothetical protein